ncbi:MAG: O-antigen ligase family protein [Ruminococcaceae bacterium]|nr:O-antigen ligase family protein [Oscillospiraceae bacterium]
MISIIAMALLALAMYFAVKKPLNLVVLYALTAATDSYGILHLLQSGFGQFSFFMQIVLFFCATRLLYLYFRKARGDLPVNHVNLQIIAFFIMVVIILITLMVRAFSEEFFFLGNFFYNAAYHSPLVLIIVLLSADSKKIFSALKVLVGLQTVIALLVIYYSENIDLIQSISSVNFLNLDSLDRVNEGKATLENLLKVVFDKYSLNQYAHFHNSNVTGFYGATALFLFAYDFVTQKKLLNRFFSIFLAGCGFFLWANSGMRGPMLGILFAAMIYFCFFSKKTWQRVVVGVFSFCVLFWFVATDQVQLISVTGVDVSVASRALRRENAWQFILQNPFFGSMGLPAPLTLSNADAHELPLYLAALYGIFAGILYLFVIYVFTTIRMIRHNNKTSMLNWGCFMIVICVSLTNCFTAPTLFWLLLALAVSFNRKERSSEKASGAL